MEVQKYLGQMLDQASSPKVSHRDLSSICAQVMSESDKEIVKVREYYDKVIEALIQERDEKISEIGRVNNLNIDFITQLTQGEEREKAQNFRSELEKVISGVKETGIHIKELQKIRYDFEEVILGRKSGQHKFDDSETIQKYEFVMLGSDSLKELAQRLGNFNIKEIPLSFYETGVDTGGYTSKTRNRNAFKEDDAPTFGNSLDNKGRREKEKRRPASIGNFRKHSKNSSRGSKKTKLLMKDKFMSDMKDPIDPIPVS
jgi:hypothetical protein